MLVDELKPDERLAGSRNPRHKYEVTLSVLLGLGRQGVQRSQQIGDARALGALEGGQFLVSKDALGSTNQRGERGVRSIDPLAHIPCAIESVEISERLWQAIRADNADAVLLAKHAGAIGIDKDRVHWQPVSLRVIVGEIVRVRLDLIDVTRPHPAALELQNDEAIRRQDDNVGTPTAFSG
jgi:hypothetical protein